VRPARDDLLDTPEVDGVVDEQMTLDAPAAAQPRATDDAVEQPPHLPRERPRVPAALPADGLDDPPQRLRGGIDRHPPFVDVQRAARPVRVARQRVARSARHGCRRPSRRHVGVLDAPQSEPHGTVEADEPARRVGDEARDVVLLADHLVHERLDERSGEPCRHGRDE